MAADAADAQLATASLQEIGADESALPPYCVLPHALLRRIFGELPVDALLLSRGVCREWRALASAPSLYAAIDLTQQDGVAMDALLAAAVRASDGRLAHLTLPAVGVSREAVVRAVCACAGSLHTLRVGAPAGSTHLPSRGAARCAGWSLAEAEQLLRAAGPQLQALSACVVAADACEGRAALLAAPPLAPLRPHTLRLHGGACTDEQLLACFAELRTSGAHDNRLHTLSVNACLSPRCLEALVDAALACGLAGLELVSCGLDASALPALARLIAQGDKLQYLGISGGLLLPPPGGAALPPAAADALAAALAGSGSLTRLNLAGVSLAASPGAAAAILAALEGHPSLRELHLASTPRLPALGAALGRIVASGAPSLRCLSAQYCRLKGRDLKALLSALRSSRLEELRLDGNAPLSERFVHAVLLPALAANASLRCLRLGRDAHAAEALISSRSATCCAGSSVEQHTTTTDVFYARNHL
jgi:hypothetical protein